MGTYERKNIGMKEEVRETWRACRNEEKSKRRRKGSKSRGRECRSEERREETQ